VARKGTNKAGQNETRLAEQRRQALELRKAGYGYEEIARALGLYDASRAHKVVQAALKATYREPADEVRKLELERLDRLTRAIWTRAIGGDGESIDRVLRLMQRRAKYLGLDLSTDEPTPPRNGGSKEALDSKIDSLATAGEAPPDPGGAVGGGS
jgi:DNA-binding transcriptional MerR regulator